MEDEVPPLKRLKISDSTDSAQSENTCGYPTKGGRDVGHQQSGHFQDCNTTNRELSYDTNCSASQTADQNDIVKQCVSAQEKILRNWKNLKEAFSHITPRKLLDIMSKGKLISVEHIPDVNKMPRSLALDCILIECTKKVFNQDTFKKFAKVTGEINKTKKIIWEPLAGNSGRLKDYIIDHDEHKTRLKKILKMEHIIKIKDDLIQQLIFSLTDQEQVVQDLLKNEKSEHFFKAIFEEDKMSKGSVSCLVSCLSEMQDFEPIKSFLKDLKESYRKLETTGDAKVIDCIPTEESEVHVSSKLVESVKIKLEIDHNGDTKKVDNALKQGVLNAIQDYTKRQGIVVGKIVPGCLEIYLSSIHDDVKKQITNILIDGAYLNLLKEIINVEEMKKLLCPGKYKLTTRIDTFQITSQSNLNKDVDVVKHLISANWSFLIDEIDAEYLMDVFDSEGIQLPGITALKDGDCREQAEHFLKVIETSGLEEKLFKVLKMEQMTYIFERLQTFKNVYAYSDLSSLRRQIKEQFSTLITAVDLDDVRQIFVERNIFETELFEILENNFEGRREQRMAQFIVEILKSGPQAMLTFVDSLYICRMKELANSLLEPIEDIVENNQENVEISSDQQTEGEECLFEGIYELIVRESDTAENCRIVTQTSLTATLDGEMYTLETVPQDKDNSIQLTSSPIQIGELKQSTENRKPLGSI